jgi:hypothetical protein
MRIILETSTTKDIPVLTLAPDDSRGIPAVFFVPGFGGTKEAGLSIGYRLARAGFFFVSLDPWLHGGRADPRLHQAADPELGGIYPAATGLDTGVLFYQVIHRCLHDIRTLIASYADDPRLNVERCGVTGPSLGGYASFLAFAELPQMLAAVPMIGIPSFTRRWLDVLDECAYTSPAWAKALHQVVAQTAAHTAFIAGIDPCEKLKTAAPRALSIMACDFDTDQPKSYSINCYRDLLPSYQGASDRLKLSIYPAAHTVSTQMEQDAVNWFSLHLGA